MLRHVQIGSMDGCDHNIGMNIETKAHESNQVIVNERVCDLSNELNKHLQT